MLNKSKAPLILGAVAAAPVLIIDIFTPAAFAVWVAYIPILALLARKQTTAQVAWTAALFAAAVYLGYALSPAKIDPAVAMLNRTLGAACLIILAYMIVRHKRAEEVIHEIDILQSIMNGAKNSHLAYLDRDFNFVRVNETYARACGYTPEEVVGKNHFALYPHKENEKIFARVRDTGQPVEFHDKPFTFPDQPERGITYWDWTLTPVKDDAGRVQGLVFSLFETTERKRAVEALRESEERARLAIEATDLGTWDYRPITGALTWDSRCKELFGLPPEAEVNYDTFLAGLHPDDRERVHKMVQETFNLAYGGGYDAEYRTVGLKDGGVLRWVRATGRAFFNEAGQAYRFTGTVQDITERKELERARADFVSMLTHDLKSPLTTIMGYSDLLAGMYRHEGEAREMVESIQRSSERMMRMVEDFLTVSRLEAGKMQLAPMPEDLSSVLDRIYADFRPAAEKKGVRLEKDYNGLPLACVDKKYMERSVGNLLQNAINFTPPGGRVTLKAESGVRGDGRRQGQYLAITVADTGPGIPEKDRGKVFERYYTAPKTGGVKGTGLGLAIVKAVAEAHGGRAAVESEPGKGSAFHIYMPLKTAC